MFSTGKCSIERGLGIHEVSDRASKRYGTMVRVGEMVVVEVSEIWIYQLQCTN